MNPERFKTITDQYPRLRIALVGDFCLDRYLEIDPTKQEVSLETGLPVHNVVQVRSQPGAAGTILNNFSALGVGEIYPIGFVGLDGEGFELRRGMESRPGVRLDHFLQTALRHTFTYCKPLIIEPGKPPVELNRLDSKNWTSTPPLVQTQLIENLLSLAPGVDAMVVMDQVEAPDTGVITRRMLDAVDSVGRTRPGLLIMADSRRSLSGYPRACYKMNRKELAAMVGGPDNPSLEEAKAAAESLARQLGRPVFVTLAERGMLGASPSGPAHHVPALAVHGVIDIVGAGDAVTANLTTALAGGATLPEALEIASAAASIVIHQLGTTGTASVKAINRLVAQEEK